MRPNPVQGGNQILFDAATKQGQGFSGLLPVLGLFTKLGNSEASVLIAAKCSHMPQSRQQVLPHVPDKDPGACRWNERGAKRARPARPAPAGRAGPESDPLMRASCPISWCCE